MLRVVMTSLHTRERVLEALRAVPMASVLVKPITPSRLFETVVRLQHGEWVTALPVAAKRADFAESLRSIRGARIS